MAFISPTIGELRWSDLKAHVGAKDDEVEVVVFGMREPAVRMHIRLTERWAGHGWARQIACSQCKQACAVARLEAGALLCNRCRPHRSAVQRHHRSRTWVDSGGKVEDELVRSLLGPRRYRPETLARCRSLGAKLVDADLERAKRVLELAESTLDVSDQQLCDRR